MKRKLIKQGGGGYTVYLPKKWIEERGLKAGDELNIDDSENTLSISFIGNKLTKEVTISISDETKHNIYVKLMHAYRVGFDKITLCYKDRSILKHIADVVKNNLLGFEIVTAEKNKCILQNITEPSEEKFSVILKRVFFQIKELNKIISEDFSSNNRNNKNEVEELRHEIDKYVNFCKRLISKNAVLNENPSLNWELLTFLLFIAHAYHYMYLAYYSDKHQKIDKAALGILSEVEAMFDLYYKQYAEMNEEHWHKKVRGIHNMRLDLDEKISKLANSSSNRCKTVLIHIYTTMRLIHIGSGTSLQIISDKTFKKQSKDVSGS